MKFEFPFLFVYVAGWGCCRFPKSQISWFLMMMTVMVGGLLPLMLVILNVWWLNILHEIHTLQRWFRQFSCLCAAPLYLLFGVEKITHFLIPATDWMSFCAKYSYTKCMRFECYQNDEINSLSSEHGTQFSVECGNIYVRLAIQVGGLLKQTEVDFYRNHQTPAFICVPHEIHTRPPLSQASMLMLKVHLSDCVLSGNEEQEKLLYSNYDYTLRTYFKMAKWMACHRLNCIFKTFLAIFPTQFAGIVER